MKFCNSQVILQNTSNITNHKQHCKPQATLQNTIYIAQKINFAHTSNITAHKQYCKTQENCTHHKYCNPEATLKHTKKHSKTQVTLQHTFYTVKKVLEHP